MKNTQINSAKAKKGFYRTLEILCAAAAIAIGGNSIINYYKNGKSISGLEFDATAGLVVGSYVSGWRKDRWNKKIQKSKQNSK